MALFVAVGSLPRVRSTCHLLLADGLRRSVWDASGFIISARLVPLYYALDICGRCCWGQGLRDIG